MELITRKSRAKEAAKNWKEKYFKDGDWWPTIRSNTEEVYNKLLALGSNPDPYEVNEIIGNSSWTDVGFCGECWECGEEVSEVMQIGQEPDYESATTEVCRSCLFKAFSIIDAQGSQQ